MYVRHDNGKFLGMSKTAQSGYDEVTGRDTRTSDGPFFFDVATGNLRNASRQEIADWELRELKEKRLKEIDRKTNELIKAANDITFGGDTLISAINAATTKEQLLSITDDRS